MREMVELTAETARQIYPGTHPEIISDEDGFVAFNFDFLYPKDLAVFTPKRFPRSRYSNAMPQNFENAFEDLDAKVNLVSRTLEVPLEGKYEKENIEFATGKLLKREGMDLRHTVFQFGIVDRTSTYKEMLCRCPYGDRIVHRIKKDKRIIRLELAEDLMHNKYIYWIMPFSSLFDDSSPLISAIFLMAHL